jgi:hypothetical protein
MNEKIQQVKNKANAIGHKIDDWVEHTAEKHSFPKWKVWLGIGIAALAVTGAAYIFGVI